MAATPPPTTVAPNPQSAKRRLVRHAALSLLAFSLLTTVALGAWFARAAQPWTWRSTLAILCVALGLLAGAAVWRAPSRATFLGGMGVMVLSLARIGAPGDWGAASWVLFLLTAALLVPLGRAALAFG